METFKGKIITSSFNSLQNTSLKNTGMNKSLLLILFIFFTSGILSAQSQNQKSPDLKSLKKIDRSDIWFVAYKVTSTPFPSEAFTVANADYFITTVQGWINADQNRYTSIINGKNSDSFVLLKKSDYYKMAPNSQDLLKEWILNIDRYFQMQANFQIDDVKRYVLSSSDFDKLQSLIK